MRALWGFFVGVLCAKCPGFAFHPMAVQSDFLKSVLWYLIVLFVFALACGVLFESCQVEDVFPTQ